MRKRRERKISKFSNRVLNQHGFDVETLEVLMTHRNYPKLKRHVDKFITESRRNFSTRNLAFSEKAVSKGRFTLHKLSGPRLTVALREGNVDLEDENLIYIKAPKGNGKTEFYKELVASFPESFSVVGLVHRRSLARTVSSRVDLQCYLDEGDLSNRLVISVDSLVRFDIENNQPYDILLIDESEQVFRHLIGETTEAQRGKIFRTLIWLVRNAKKIICADADMTSDLTCYVIEKLRGSFQHESNNVTAILNQWPSIREIDIYENKYHLISNMFDGINAGEKAYISVATKKLAEEIANVLKELKDKNGNEIKFLTLTGDTSKEDEAEKFFLNPNAEVTKYDVLISTSTLSTGVSIDVEWFDAVYGIFDSGIYTFQDCDQAISRVRKCETVKVWVHPGPKAVHGTEADLRAGPVKKEILTRSYAIPDKDGKLSDGDELYMDVSARIQWCVSKWRCKMDKQFISLKEDDGWLVNYVHKDLSIVAIGQELMKFARDPDGEKYFKKVLNAKDLSPEEFEDICYEKNLRGEKSYAKSKFIIAKFFELRSPSELTLNQIKSYKQKNIIEIIKNSKLLKEDRVSALNNDRWEREDPNNARPFTSFGHRTVMRDFFKNVQEVTSINHADVLRRAREHVENEKQFALSVKSLGPSQLREARKAARKKKADLRWVVKLEQIDALAKYVEANLEDINLFFGSNFKNPTAAETRTKVFNTVMGHLGVELKKDRRKEGEEQPVYYIDYDRVADLVATKDLTQLIGA
ncbi:hypothetical protein KW842_25220 [Duganella sp. sic0402]|uniref:plasmid replication protein, CyRepA1 family n=1 Tax=Duganella sp. sic0402 TaxID=2854786 RepID=UPI001C48415E|nr:plasmid replication protein, CyRepA1 family [Duganella sp. sic0402]MBV7539074.1 hypothetical protein [Duganella sp. sic0402]